MGRDLLDNWCERGLLGLVLAMLVFSPLALGTVRPQDFLVVQWLTVALLALGSVCLWLRRDRRLYWPPMCWAVAAFVAYAVGRYLAADIEFVARQELVRVLVYAAVFFVILNLSDRPDPTRWIVWTLILLGAGIGMYAVGQFLTGSDRVWHFQRPLGYHGRGSGTFICPNSTAGYLETVLPLALAYAFWARVSHVARIGLGYGALMILCGLGVTLSRGGWWATALTSAVFLYWLVRERSGRVKGWIAVVVLVALAVGFLGRAQLPRDRADRLHLAAQAGDMRLGLWISAWELWQDHFWLGAGPAHFDYRYGQYRPRDFEFQGQPDRVHNDYLNTLADWGLIGAVLVASVWLLFFWELTKAWKLSARGSPLAHGLVFGRDRPDTRAGRAGEWGAVRPERSASRALWLGGALGLLALLLHSWVDFNFHIPANALLAVTLLALVSRDVSRARADRGQQLRIPSRLALSVVIVCALGYLGWQGAVRGRELTWLVRAKQMKNVTPEYLAALQAAHRIEPKNGDTAYLLGESFRLKSFQGQTGYQDAATEALRWFDLSQRLNRHDAFPVIGTGLCLHWLGRHAEAKAAFRRAFELEPGSYYTLAYLGWHHFQVGEYAFARHWFRESLNLRSTDNQVATAYLPIVEARLAEKAAVRKR